ncbi:serine/threonine-protein kinase Nek4-like isoform X4 [Anguilla anguilla]|uniref:serine/threonine-protein kinase Nek4-like isoform X4 n=1 Tax=Anguilla anguilla TaxID=7936 RepID=UPI0015AA4AD4|nr:serine/threonine-protein kinase Nek4-like isoform X4 [Anguilla anguilla]
MGNNQSILEQHGYTLVGETGQGAFGKALRVKNEKDGKDYVIKTLQKTNMMREVSELEALKHPFIVQYNDSFEDDMNVYIVMEYCEGGNLSEEIKKQKDTGEYFPEDQILTWFVEICMAVEYVHEKNILHRDIKPQNIFLDKYGRTRLGDFGLAKPLERSSGYARTVVGTFCYRSPERIMEEPYSSKSDVWALGCVLYELCELKHAFPEENLRKLFNKILDGPYPSVSEPFSTDLRDLVRDLLQKNPADRPSASDILGRPFLLGILIQKTKGIPEELQQKLKELDGVADGLERVLWRTILGSLASQAVRHAQAAKVATGAFAGVSPEDREPRLCGNSRWMKPGDSDPSAPFPTGESSARDCEVEGVVGVDMSRVCVCSQGKECVYEQGWCSHCCGPHSLREECLLSDPQGDSDADADIEDTDNRLQGGSPLQRMSSRRRRRQRLARPDTTESEDDGGRSHRAHRWSLRLSPHRTHNRTILEESVSQVRPLVLCRPCGRTLHGVPTEDPRSRVWHRVWSGVWSMPMWPLLLIMPLSVIIILMVLLLPQTDI